MSYEQMCLNNYDILYTARTNVGTLTRTKVYGLISYTFTTSTAIQTAFVTSAAFMKTTENKFLHVDFKCDAAAYELFLDIGSFYNFDKDAAADATYAAKYLGNCSIQSLDYDDVDIVSVTGDATFISATPTTILFDDTDDTYTAG